ncbi:extracellular solute-binding protein [Parasalinivibrio latis]|uniref:ABC transporter substrate-binding protein n=1 Tax=Parasalinivibrio latis TaxID=2952610 RepID=UPI0030E50988
MNNGMKASILATVLMSNFAIAKTTINFWTWAPSESTLNAVIEKFEEENPDIDVNLTLLESTAYQDRLPLALASGDSIDVAAVQTSTMVNVVKDFLEPLTPLYSKHANSEIETQLNNSALSQAKSLADNGVLYIAPMGMLGSVVAFYNKDLMDELGLSVPQNREELASFVKTIETKRPDLLPISFTGANWFLDEIANTISEQVKPGLFNLIRYDEGGKWQSEEYSKTFDTLVSLYNDGIFSKDTLDIDYARAVELFQTQKSVMFLQGSWESGILSAPFREANGITLNNVTASGFPVVVEGGKKSLRSFIEVGLSVPLNSENKKEAVKFIEFITHGAGVDVWSENLFMVPTKIGYELPEGIFSTEAARKGYEETASLLSNPGSDRNNVSDFSAKVGDTIISSIVNGKDTQSQVEMLQSEWESGRYSNDF